MKLSYIPISEITQPFTVDKNDILIHVYYIRTSNQFETFVNKTCTI